MRVRILLQVATDEADYGAAEEVAIFEKRTAGIEDLGLSLAEGKTLLAAAQRRMVERQTAAWLDPRDHCASCGKRLRSKGSYPMVFRTLFGDVRLSSPRFRRCRCTAAGAATVSPLRELIVDHVAPERLYLATRWASLAPYAATAAMLADVLPVATTINATTIREHVLRVAERVEAELGEERPCFIDGCPLDWQQLPCPEGRIVVGLDGGYVRDWSEKTTNFELIVGRSLPEDRPSRYLGLVHGYDRKPKRRLVALLESQGLQANQDITFLTDGGDNVRELAERMSPCAEHILDWFHLTMRLTVLGQYAKGLKHHDPEQADEAEVQLEKIKWYLWNGNVREALFRAKWLADDLDDLTSDYPGLKRFARTATEFCTYLANNAGAIPNYAERWRYGERVATSFVESTVNLIVGKRFAKRQQMQWSARGAHLLLQTRTRVLDGTLRATFAKWYPGLAANDQNGPTPAAAA